MENKNELLYNYNLQRFAKDGPGGEKTEPATPHKLNEARKEGQVAKSKELTAAFDLLVLFIVLKMFVSFVGENLINIFREIYQKIPEIESASISGLSINSATLLLTEGIVVLLQILAPFFIFGIIVAFFINIFQVGWKVTTKPMMPKFSKLNPLSGFKRIFSSKSLFELLKSFLKILLIGYIAITAIIDEQDKLFLFYDIPLIQVVIYTGNFVIDTGLQIAIVYMILGIVDYLYEKHKFNEEQKMTKQEVKDEHKNMEGNPEIKGKQRARMREASQRRMMQSLPTADVVITNPTHISVAIKYDAKTNLAPVVLAKGEDYLALRIRETAKEHKIEIVENKPLARMLYTNVEIGEEVPPELYQAVAEVLAFVYNLKKGYAPSGKV